MSFLTAPTNLKTKGGEVFHNLTALKENNFRKATYLNALNFCVSAAGFCPKSIGILTGVMLIMTG